jgi:hypothetical protein
MAQRIVGVEPYKVWVNQKTGARVSIGGSVPWFTESQREEWVLEQRGYTCRWANGTTGMGCNPPAKTEEDAQAFMDRVNAR